MRIFVPLTYTGVLFYLLWFHGLLQIFDIFNGQDYSRTRELDSEELLDQLPALQQLLYRLIGCRVFFLYVNLVEFGFCFLNMLRFCYLFIFFTLSGKLIDFYALFAARRCCCRQLCYTVCFGSGMFALSFFVTLCICIILSGPEILFQIYH